MESEKSASTTASESRIAKLEHEIEEKDALIRELLGKLSQMQKRMESRKAIDKAKCLLIEDGATEEEAFARMRTLSMNTRKPLGEIAEAIILAHQASHAK